MINWYPKRIFPAIINKFSPRLQKVLTNPEDWGLDGQYHYYGERLERNRLGSGAPYTEWVDREEIIFVRLEFEGSPPNRTYREVSLDESEIDINPEGDIVSNHLFEWLKDLSRQDGYELVNISEADLNISDSEYNEPFTMSGVGGSGDFSYTGNGESFGYEWTAKVDFSNWRQVKL